MNRRAIALLLPLGILLILFSQPALAATYSQPYYSPPFRDMPVEDQRAFAGFMEKGDALQKAGNHYAAVKAYHAAERICPADYTVQAALGGEYASLATQMSPSDVRDEYLRYADSYLQTAKDLLKTYSHGQEGYEYHDLMSKIWESQADIGRAKGRADLVEEAELTAAGEREKANQSLDNPGSGWGTFMPMSPVVPLLGLAAAGVLVLSRSGKKE